MSLTDILTKKPHGRKPMSEERRKEIIRENSRKSYAKPSGKYALYKSASKRRNIIFELTLEEFIILTSKPCFYCGQTERTNGIDRIDNNKGYIKGNMVSCCWPCNHFKSNRDFNEFMTIIAKIYEFHHQTTI